MGSRPELLIMLEEGLGGDASPLAAMLMYLVLPEREPDEETDEETVEETGAFWREEDWGPALDVVSRALYDNPKSSRFNTIKRLLGKGADSPHIVALMSQFLSPDWSGEKNWDWEYALYAVAVQLLRDVEDE